jgi:hypothetical protein
MSRVLLLARMLRSRVLAVARPIGYFDEAGIHSQSLVIAVAGYVAPDRDWRRLEIKWNKVLKAEGAAFYHTTDIEADPPRGIYKGWSRAKADRLTDRIIPLAAEFNGRAYGVHIMASAWYRAVPFVKKFLPARAHDGPYLLLVKNCIESVIHAQSDGFKEQIGFVFARNDYSHQVLAGYEIMKQTGPPLLGPVGIDDMPENAMLQAADLVAWHYRNAIEIRNGMRHQQIHRGATALLRPDDLFKYISEEAFSIQTAALFRKHGPEWNQQVWAKMLEYERRRQERQRRGLARRQDQSRRRGGDGPR